MRGRPRLEYTDQFLKDMRCATYSNMKRMADDREAWRVAANQPNGWGSDGQGACFYGGEGDARVPVQSGMKTR
ncbi:hypothetical protein LSTR_LSTR006209 [Laodelphax striatellus]|uniref:Uncharacterized protein n=1 Tax=Laodelphax striatellus TaxID=195883 RepID=A0A482XQM6_LAOST|nr:hypothetical protein LSTR_LSTR006209 [Laodelphax striatellus]